MNESYIGSVSLENSNTTTKYLVCPGNILSDLHVLEQLNLTKPYEVGTTIISILVTRGKVRKLELTCHSHTCI